MTFDALIVDILDRSCAETFGDGERRAGLPLRTTPYAQVALLGFSGVRHRGHVGVAVPPETAARLCPVGEDGAGLLVSDQVGELGNQLLGRVKAQFERFGMDVHCGTPVVLRESSLSLSPSAAEGPVLRRATTVETPAGEVLAWIDLAVPEELPTLVEDYEEPPDAGEALFFDTPPRAPVVQRALPVVLFVDDEEPNRVIFDCTIGRQFDTVVASSGAEALAILLERPVDVLVTDNRMPKMSGVELCERVRARHPDVQRILLTAYSDLRTVSEAINRGGVSRYLAKPWNPAELTAAISDAATAARVSWLVRELQTAMANQERLSALAAARGQVLHDLANLTSLVASCCTSLEGVARRAALPRAEATDLASEVGELRVATDSLRALHTRVRGLNRHSEPEPSLTEVAPLLQAVVALSRVWLPPSARLEVRCPAGTTAWCDHTDLGRILINLVTNAAQALVGAGTREGRVVVQAERIGDEVRLGVSDNGPGIPASLRTRVFEPHFTTRGEAGLTGLGLAICHQLTLGNGGTLALVDSAVGATFALTLPAEAPARK